MLLVYCLQTQIVQLKKLKQIIFMKTIGYPEDSKFFDPDKKKVIDNMKDEVKGKKSVNLLD